MRPDLIAGKKRDSELLNASDAPLADTDAVITIAAQTIQKIRLTRVISSYDNIPSGGILTIAFGATVKYIWYIAQAGPIPLVLDNCVTPINTSCVITLTGGGTGVLGALSIEYTVEPANQG